MSDTRAVGERWVKRDPSIRSGCEWMAYVVWERGESGPVQIADGLSETDARLLATGAADLARLRERVAAMEGALDVARDVVSQAQAWTLGDKAVDRIPPPEAKIRCDYYAGALRFADAALAGRPAGG